MIYPVSKFQVYNSLLFAIVIMMCSRSPELFCFVLVLWCQAWNPGSCAYWESPISPLSLRHILKGRIIHLVTESLHPLNIFLSSSKACNQHPTSWYWVQLCFSDSKYKWDHAVIVILNVVYFKYYDVFQVHLCLIYILFGLNDILCFIALVPYIFCIHLFWDTTISLCPVFCD